MTLSDRASEAQASQYARHQPPADYQPGRHIVGDSGTATTEATPEEVDLRHHDDLLRLAQLDPTVWKIADPNQIDARMWQGYHMQYMHYYKFPVVRRDAVHDLPALMQAVQRAGRRKPVKYEGLDKAGFRGAVIVWADPQTGKTDERGGVPELIDRVASVQGQLDGVLKAWKPTEIAFLDLGDGVEGFENTAGQAHTNGLSFIDQLDLEATMEFDTIELARRHAPVTVAKTTSNHAAWRKGKDYLGKPGDDWGLKIGRELEQRYAFADEAVRPKFLYSHPWDHSMSFNFGGTIIGLHHGHMVSRPEGVKDWWAKQQHGAGAVADADILVTGHFHHLRVEPTGRNRLTGKVKWWLQAPTLDNGSSWYRNRAGDDSDPGLLVFLVDEDGFNLRSLDVLNPPKPV